MTQRYFSYTVNCISQKAHKEIIGFELEKLKNVYVRNAHTYTPEEFEKIQEDLKAEDSVKKETARALEQFISLPEQKIASGETDRILENLTREYHRSTGS